MTDLRIGCGYDVHKLVSGRELYLCGVKIPHTLGLLGHSDADVAIHALCDAILGAAALGDIGRHFPDTDMKYKGINSMIILKKVNDMLTDKGYEISNIDSIIVAQKPKCMPYIMQMRENVSNCLGLNISQINIKATTTEALGFEGRGEGISAYSSALINEIQRGK
mgnify:CR=1 FL=1